MVCKFLQNQFGSEDKTAIAEAIVNDSEFCYVKNLYSAYEEYCNANGTDPLSRKKFIEKLCIGLNLNIKKVGLTLPSGAHCTMNCFVAGE